MSADRHLGKVDDKFTIDDVGSHLLDELARGLYKPSEVIREYIQNAVDAHRLWKSDTGLEPETPIQVEIREDAISVMDSGIGMDEIDIREVKSIAVSRKPQADIQLTGHKGVGIWAGLSFFESLTMYSTKRGIERAYELTVNFKDIVQAIDDETSVGKALNPNYWIDEYEANPQDHFTFVTLRSPVREGEWFLERENVQAAVRRICPCEVDPTFAFSDELLSWYDQISVEQFQVHIDGEPVYRSYPSSVENIKSGVITIDDEPVASYWHAINKKNRILKPHTEQIAGMRVFVDGFAVGDANPYSQKDEHGFGEIKIASYLNWHIGEVHLRHEEIRPDLPRRRFEDTEVSRQFIRRLRAWYQQRADDARFVSERRNLQKKYAKYEARIEALDLSENTPVISSDSAEEIEVIYKDLLDEERIVKRKKGKRSATYKVKALREVRPPRKKLISMIKDWAPSSVTSAEGDGAQPKNGSDSSVEDDREKAAAESTGGSPASIAEVDLENETLMSSEATHVPMEVVLGVLREVLSNELEGNHKEVEGIISELISRLNSVLTDD